ncbi:cardiolipin synthase [Bacillus manliponensis]|uniref:cardiolipin synthase n=1 Tax=Bacillus manliponensis TaxID=574376 RepID=UPI003513E98A
MIFLSLFFIFLLLWLVFDFTYGRKLYIQKLKPLSFPLRHSNFQLYTSGQTLYDNLFFDIAHAKEHIHILFFIVKNDEVSHTFLNLLMKKAKEGIEVRLLLDRLGSHYVSKETITQLREHGIAFSFSHKIRPPFLFFTANQRNHRKITIIDGEIGYLGGFNIGEEYLGHNPNLGPWRDYHLRITGEGVLDLQNQFLHDWQGDTKEKLIQEARFFKSLQKGTTPHQFVPTNGAYLEETFLHLIQKAEKKLYIGTPYFIPGKKVLHALQTARKRGVQITILVPKKADHPFVREAKLPYCRNLIAAGCNIYEFQNGFFHAKLIMIDDQICDIGTANFDMRSLYINHEINCIIYDSFFLEQVKAAIQQDIEASILLSLQDVSPKTPLNKMKEWIGTVFSYFL